MRKDQVESWLDTTFGPDPEPGRAERPRAAKGKRCASYLCHGACGRRPSQGSQHSAAKERRRAHDRVAKASRKANRD